MSRASETPRVERASGAHAGGVSADSSERYARVIVPIVGTVPRGLARLAAQLAARMGVPAEVLAVVSAGLEDDDEMQLQSDIVELGVAMSVRVVIDDGDVAGAVLAEAAVPLRLICLEYRGPTVFGDALFGSVATEIIRRSRREVLVVGPYCEPDLRGDTLLITIDGSAAARAIVPTAVDLAGVLDLRPGLVQVLPGRSVSPNQTRADLARLDDLAPFAQLVRQNTEPILVQGSRVDDALVAIERAAARCDVGDGDTRPGSHRTTAYRQHHTRRDTQGPLPGARRTRESGRRL